MIICFNKIIGVCIFVLVVFAGLVFGWGSEKIQLKEVQVLTLYAGRHTSYRREEPVPQLKCLGGSAGCQDAPQVVQCTNSGWDGRQVHWECKAEMPVHMTFGRMVVNCEGYDHAGDREILVGSCGLEYYLETARGKSVYDWKTSERDNDKESGWSCLVYALLFVVFLFFLYGLYLLLLYFTSENECCAPACEEEEEVCCESEEESPEESPDECRVKKPKKRKPPKPKKKKKKAKCAKCCTGNQVFWAGAVAGGIFGFVFTRDTSAYIERFGWGSGTLISRFFWRNDRSWLDVTTHAALGYGGTIVR